MDLIQYRPGGWPIGPVQQYWNELKPLPADPLHIVNKKIDLRTLLNDKIQYVKDRDARPEPPHASPLQGYSFAEIKCRRTAKVLIRIPFFRHNNSMVLLHAFEKPSSYDGKKEKKEVTKEFEIAKEYQEDFIRNPTHFEPYDSPPTHLYDQE
jgi:hypothetical protein